jgi:hypothetical protein
MPLKGVMRSDGLVPSFSERPRSDVVSNEPWQCASIIKAAAGLRRDSGQGLNLALE